MRKKIVLLALAAVCLGTLAGGTLAYFTAQGTAHNVITSGAVDIAIEQWQDTEAGRIPDLDEARIPVMPGVTVSKIVTVKNLDADAFIRAKVEILLTDGSGKKMELSEEELGSIISVAVNEDDWRSKDDGWLYYAGAVQSDASTRPLFTQVAFDGPNMTNAYQNCRAEIIVKAQAVQAANNGGNVLEVIGWPEE